MKLHAGSLYTNKLILYGAPSGIQTVITIDDHDVQWNLYCNDLDVEFLDGFTSKVSFEGKEYLCDYFHTENAMKALGFGA